MHVLQITKKCYTDQETEVYTYVRYIETNHTIMVCVD